MMIKEAVNSPEPRGEMNHSQHHYRLFWSALTVCRGGGALDPKHAFDMLGLEIFADRYK